MKKTIILLTMGLALLIALQGCTQRIGDFTLMSTKNVEIGGKYKKLDQRFEGIDSKAMILGIPLGVPDLKQAVDNCIEAGNGELITNAVVENKFWTAIVYGEVKYVVKGDVWVRAATSDLQNPDIELFELLPGNEGYQLVAVADPTDVVKVDYLTMR
jgi:hypothetical protein